MDQNKIKDFLESFRDKLFRTIVIIDFSNVDKWQESLGWKMGINELAHLIRYFSKGNKDLRRFYYGSDYGQKDSSNTLLSWSETVLTKAEFNHLNIVTKRVKYIHSDRLDGFQKKCDLDVEMTVDLIRLREEYDNIILFSGDGDLFYVLKYLREEFKKSSYVFSARNHIGKELMDGVKEGILEKIVYIDDFKYRLDADRFKYR